MTHRKRTVLSVDDDETNQLVMTSVLEGAGFNVVQLYSGQECLDYLEKSYSKVNPSVIPDIVLLDVLMPGIDGFETCHQIRARFPATLPVIMVSAKICKSERIKALSFALANDYLTKPFDRAIMLAKIEARINIAEAIADTVFESQPDQGGMLVEFENGEDMLTALKMTNGVEVSKHGSNQCLLKSKSCDLLVSSVSLLSMKGAIGFLMDEQSLYTDTVLPGLHGSASFVSKLTSNELFEKLCLQALERRLEKGKEFQREFSAQLVNS